MLHNTQNLSTQKTTFITVKFSDKDVKVNHTQTEVQIIKFLVTRNSTNFINLQIGLLYRQYRFCRLHHHHHHFHWQTTSKHAG
jgi:hypothetical protein